MLVSLAQELGPGRSVVRLKAGDPFVYGRARGEAEALSAADVPFRVLPGLSSALTAPLLAGVPVTDPRLSRAFAVLSGHDLQGATPHDLSGFRAADTLIFLMAGSKLGEIAAELVAVGRAPSTPVLVVRWAGHPERQQEWRGTLETIASVTKGHAVPGLVSL